MPNSAIDLSVNLLGGVGLFLGLATGIGAVIRHARVPAGAKPSVMEASEWKRKTEADGART